MPFVICPTSIQCPGSDAPILNISSEAPDHFYWWNYIYPFNQCYTRLNCDPGQYYQRDCFGVMYSSTSQADADLQAQLASVNCNPPGGGNVSCVNEAQTATAYCADGSPVTYTTAAGMFASPLLGSYDACLASANAQALSYAQQQASLLAQLNCPKNTCAIVTDPLLANGFLGQPYHAQINSSVTELPKAYSIIVGALPPGLTLNSAGVISGTPTVIGAYSFRIALHAGANTFCTKKFALTIVGVLPTAYWKMEQFTDETDLIDSIGGCNMRANGGHTKGGVAAKIGLGQEFSYFRLNTGFSGVANSNLDYTTGNSFSLWGWFKIEGTGPVSSGQFGSYLSYFTGGPNQLMIDLANSDNPGNVHFFSAANDIYINVSIGEWHFFHLFYDAVTSKPGYSIDGGAEVMMPNSEAWPSRTNCIMIMQAGPLMASADVIFDEVGIVTTSKLSVDQAAYLYNSGNGRTYPF